MASIEKVYQEGRNVILQKYPEYYLWDFYNINENFDFTYKQIPPDKSECLIVGFKMNRNRALSSPDLFDSSESITGKIITKT